MKKQPLHTPLNTAKMLKQLPAEELEKLQEVWDLAGNLRGAQSQISSESSRDKLRVWSAVCKVLSTEKEDDAGVNNARAFGSTEEYLDTLPEDSRSALSEVWNLAGKANTNEDIKLVNHHKSIVWKRISSELGSRTEPAHIPHITPVQTNSADEVNVTTINSSKNNTKANQQPSAVRLYWLAAAVLTIGLAVWMVQFFTSQSTYSAPFGETLTVQLDDGSQVQLNSGSELRVDRGFGEKNRNLELAGEAYFDVEHSDMPFMVYTANAIVQVLGTSFNLRSWPGTGTTETTIALINGSVQFSSGDESEMAQLMSSGEISRIRGIRTIPEKLDVHRLDEALAWRSSNIAFSSTRLVDAVAELERRFNVSITLENKSAAQQMITGFYQNPDKADGILKDLASIAGLQLTVTESGFKLQ